MTRYFLRHPLSGVAAPRKFKIAFEGCAEDHAFASIHDIGWHARLVDGRRGFRVTVAGGTSILPVSGYVLYDFLPVEEMLDVAEAIVRVFHRFGDYEHRQRNRMKFTVSARSGGRVPARFEEALEEFRREGGATLPFDPGRVESELRPTGRRRPALAARRWPRRPSTPCQGPGIVPGACACSRCPDAYVRWMRSNVTPQRQDGYCHVTVRLPLGDFTAGQMRVLADLAEAYGDGSVRLTVEQNVLYRWVRRDVDRPSTSACRRPGSASPTPAA
jgi:sulfite reductase (ferredoxin)